MQQDDIKNLFWYSKQLNDIATLAATDTKSNFINATLAAGVVQDIKTLAKNLLKIAKNIQQNDQK